VPGAHPGEVPKAVIVEQPPAVIVLTSSGNPVREPPSITEFWNLEIVGFTHCLIEFMIFFVKEILCYVKCNNSDQY